MFSHIQKWGNSLGVRIPAQLAKKLNLHAGSSVILGIEKGRLVVHTPKYDLDTMLNAITHQNRHNLAIEDSQMGNEEW